MNTKLIIQPRIDTPRIVFDNLTGDMTIEGKSFPPDVTTVFSGALNWIDEYMEHPASKTVLSLKLDYFNTASSKIIMDILYKMEELHKKGNDVLIKWIFPEDDDDMQETGMEYSEIVEVPFEQIGYKFIMD